MCYVQKLDKSSECLKGRNCIFNENKITLPISLSCLEKGIVKMNKLKKLKRFQRLYGKIEVKITRNVKYQVYVRRVSGIRWDGLCGAGTLPESRQAR